MTEDEAKMRPCIGPESCGRVFYDTGALRKPRLCIGSECLAWRRYHPTAGHEYGLNVGYCGLAGKPVEAEDD